MVYEMVFASIGFMAILLVMSWWLYQFGRMYKGMADLDTKYMMFEELSLDKFAKSKDLDLEKEIAKKKLISSEMKKHSFRSRLKQEAYEGLFGKEDK